MQGGRQADRKERCIPWRERMTEKPTPVAERQQETSGNVVAIYSFGGGPLDHWPDTGNCPARKGADAVR